MGKGEQYTGPILCVLLTKADVSDAPARYKWQIKMSAPDAGGTRQLGYKADGLLADLDSGSLTADFGIQVHDHERDVWTTMNPGDRKDIRQRIFALVDDAMKAARQNGHS